MVTDLNRARRESMCKRLFILKNKMLQLPLWCRDVVERSDIELSQAFDI
jgi:hypothetical protein